MLLKRGQIQADGFYFGGYYNPNPNNKEFIKTIIVYVQDGVVYRENYKSKAKFGKATITNIRKAIADAEKLKPYTKKNLLEEKLNSVK